MGSGGHDTPIDLRSDDAFTSACIRYYFDDLNLEEFNALHEALDTDPLRRRTFIDLALQVEQIVEIFGESNAIRLVEDEIEHDEYSFEIMDELVTLSMASRRQKEREAEYGPIRLLPQASATGKPREEPTRPSRVIVIPKAVVWFMGAAALVLLSLLIYEVQNTSRQSTPADEVAEDTGAQEPGEPAPVVLTAASITGSYQARWEEPPTGDRLALGKLHHLLDGVVELKLDAGTAAIVQAPAVFELMGPNDVRLLEGRFTADVPEPAQGFQVITPHLLLTDLGTTFGVEVDHDAEESHAHVFSGRVLANSPGAEDRIEPHVDLLTGQGVSASRQRSASRDAVNPGRYLRRLEDAPFMLEASDNVRLLDTPPASLLPGALESNQWLYAFLEQSGVLVAEPVSVSIHEPGVYTHFGDTGAARRLVGPVDSYLFHLDPVGNDESHFMSGSITFPRPVVGVIASESGLINSDAFFASRATRMYRPATPLGSPFGLDGVENTSVPSKQLDRLELSEDRRTIHFRLHVRSPFDEFRVLIESQEGVQ